MSSIIHQNSVCKNMMRNAFSLLALTFAITTVSSFTVPRVLPAVSALKRSTPQHQASAQTAQTTQVLTSASVLPDDTSIRRKGTFGKTFRRRTRAAVGKLFPPKQKTLEEIDYERRKQEWAARYTNVDALRETFGANKNKLWGDLDPITSRRLYKTLLPRALLELLKIGARPEDLAPLAYKARLAAKMYARERSTVPARVAATTFDIVRQWRAYGKIQPNGMTYPQVFDKYLEQVLDEGGGDSSTHEDMTAKICLKILEKSCQTNQRIDKWFLREEGGDERSIAMKEQAADLSSVTEQLEKDVHELLKCTASSRMDDSSKEAAATRFLTLRLLVRAKQRLERIQERQEHPRQRIWEENNGDDA